MKEIAWPIQRGLRILVRLGNMKQGGMVGGRVLSKAEMSIAGRGSLEVELVRCSMKARKSPVTGFTLST